MIESKYLDNLRWGDLALFCGAGISKKSGLPLANEFKRYILEKLSIEKENLEELMHSNLPFEAFMEIVSENTDISKLLDIFEKGEPNTNHILIGRLAKIGYLKTIMTTNFDLLIEKALEESEGLRRNIDFDVFYNEEQFSKIDNKNIDDKKIRIFKIHGSVDHRDSLRATMKAVASKTLSEKRMNAVRYLFSTGNHEKVLILGYSCSDDFDITPQIQSINKNQKEIIFIEHPEGGKEIIEDLKIKGERNPFKRFPGKRIRCNTDEYVRHLWNSLEKDIGKYKPIESKVDWKTCIDDWAKSWETEYPKYLMLGITLLMSSNFEKAIACHKNALEIAKLKGDEGVEKACYTNIAEAFFGLGQLNKTIEYHEKALEIALKIGNRVGQVHDFRGIGKVYCDLGNFKKAIEYFQKALEISESIVVEPVSQWCFYADLIQKLGIDVHLANPSKVKAIAAARIKTDTIDVNVLCDLLQTNLLPEAYFSPPDVRF